jgi:alkylation response protein AidB-like acyl-CoA dehydrogenase
MNLVFEPDPQAEQFRDAVRAFCGDLVAEAEVRRAMALDHGFDRALWERIARELGAFGIAVPQALGGEGQGLLDLGVVVEEFGAALLPGPVIGTLALAIPALVAAPDGALRAQLLADLISGKSCAAFAIAAGSGRFVPAELPVSATPGPDDWSLAGIADDILDVGGADFILVPARTPGGVGLFVVAASDPGLTLEPVPAMDLTRRRANLTFSDCTGRPIAIDGAAMQAIERAFLAGTALLCAEQVGSAGRLFEMTVDYIKERVQFGRAIGSFQAIKHRAADLLVALEHARSLSRNALWTLDASDEGMQLAVSQAKAQCSETAYRIAAAAIQLHGGIGFTWEHPVHLYFKRAVTSLALLGSPEQHRDIVAAEILDQAPVAEAIFELV